MLLTVVGCGGNGDDTQSSAPAGNEDFFNTTITENSSEQGTNSDTQSNNNSQAGPTTSTGTSSGNDDYKAEPEVPGMSWAQVLAKMPKKLKGTSITVFNWNPAKEYTGAPKAIEKFTAQTGIKVVWQTIPYDTYFTKLPAVINSGKGIPDVVRARGPIPEYMLSYQPLSTAKFDFSDEAWDQEVLDLYTVNGIQYAVNLKNTHIGAINVMFYNKSLIDKLNMEDPYKLWKQGKWNWEKYLEMCRDYKNETGNPGSCGEAWYWSYPSVFGIDSAVAFDGKKFYNNMNNKDFLTVHQTLGDLYNKEKLFAFGQESFFNEGNRLFSIGSSVHMRRENSYFGSLKSEGVLYAVPMPAPKKAKKYTQGLNEAEAYAIANGAPNPEAVPYFLRYFLDGANYELSTYFCNKQNLEVYNWCMNQRNKTFVYAYPNSETADVEDGFKDKIGEDMKNFINANKGNVDKFVKEYNTTIKKVNQ
jgi:multiple sugar transport system substrate-binding protein